MDALITRLLDEVIDRRFREHVDLYHPNGPGEVGQHSHGPDDIREAHHFLHDEAGTAAEDIREEIEEAVSSIEIPEQEPEREGGEGVETIIEAPAEAGGEAIEGIEEAVDEVGEAVDELAEAIGDIAEGGAEAAEEAVELPVGMVTAGEEAPQRPHLLHRKIGS